MITQISNLLILSQILNGCKKKKEKKNDQELYQQQILFILFNYLVENDFDDTIGNIVEKIYSVETGLIENLSIDLGSVGTIDLQDSKKELFIGIISYIGKAFYDNDLTDEDFNLENLEDRKKFITEHFNFSSDNYPKYKFTQDYKKDEAIKILSNEFLNIYSKYTRQFIIDKSNKKDIFPVSKIGELFNNNLKSIPISAKLLFLKAAYETIKGRDLPIKIELNKDLKTLIQIQSTTASRFGIDIDFFTGKKPLTFNSFLTQLKKLVTILQRLNIKLDKDETKDNALKNQLINNTESYFDTLIETTILSDKLNDYKRNDDIFNKSIINILFSLSDIYNTYSDKLSEDIQIKDMNYLSNVDSNYGLFRSLMYPLASSVVLFNQEKYTENMYNSFIVDSEDEQTVSQYQSFTFEQIIEYELKIAKDENKKVITIDEFMEKYYFLPKRQRIDGNILKQILLKKNPSQMTSDTIVFNSNDPINEKFKLTDKIEDGKIIIVGEINIRYDEILELKANSEDAKKLYTLTNNILKVISDSFSSEKMFVKNYVTNQLTKLYLGSILATFFAQYYAYPNNIGKVLFQTLKETGINLEKN